MEVKQLILAAKFIESDSKIAEIKDALNCCKNICAENMFDEIGEQIQLISSNQALINKAILNTGNVPKFDDFFTNLDEIRTIFGVAIGICKSKNE